MSRITCPTGTVVGVEHFWARVVRWPDHLQIPPQFAGPFTLKDENGVLGAHSVAWRVQYFKITTDFSSRPNPGDPYAGANNIDVTLGMGESVLDGVTTKSPIGSENQYTDFQYTGGNAITDVQLLTASEASLFYPGSTSLTSTATFLYQTSTGFYIGVFLFVSPSVGGGAVSLIIPSDAVAFTEQTTAFFSVFGKRVPVYAATADDAAWTGSGEITVADGGYWPYDNGTGPIYDVNTGATILNPFPVTML